MSRKIFCPKCNEMVQAANFCEKCGFEFPTNESNSYNKNKFFSRGIGTFVESIIENQTGKPKEEIREDISKAAKTGRNFIKNAVESATDFVDDNIENNGKKNINLEDDDEDYSEVENLDLFDDLDLKSGELKQYDFLDEKLEKDKKLLELGIISEDEFKKLNNS